MDKLELTAQIVQDKHNKDVFLYDDKEWMNKVKRFKSLNFAKKVNISFEVVDTPMYFLFKYYYGYLLPDIAKELGESNQDYVDKMILKKQFLFIEIDNDFSKIDKKHKSGNQFFTEKIMNVDNNNVPRGGFTDYVTGYTPSKACITHEEMKQFITKCENFLSNYLGGCIDTKHQDQALDLRKKGFDQKSLDDMGEKIESEDSFDDKTLFED
jgi:hypothetical protein